MAESLVSSSCLLVLQSQQPLPARLDTLVSSGYACTIEIRLLTFLLGLSTTWTVPAGTSDHTHTGKHD